MKTNISLLIVGSILTVSCSTTNMTYTSPNSTDDLYYSKADAKAEPIFHEEVQVQDMSPANSSRYGEEPQVQNPSSQNYYNQEQNNTSNPNTQNPNYSTNSESYTDENGKTVINNYYGDVYEDDGGYYSTRIQRFHRPFVGFGYYSPAYCGFYNDPFWSPGWSIGFGYSYGWGASWNMGFNYGWYDPFYSPWYDPWYNPWYGYGGWGGYNAYRWGYRDGYWDGRNDGNWYNGNNSYYGNKNTVLNRPRPSRGGTVSAGGNRTAPSRDMVPASSGNTESVRSLPPTRANVNTNAVERNTTTDRTNDVRNVPTREVTPVRNNTNNGYVPPRLPSSTKDEGLPSRNNGGNSSPKSETIIRTNPNASSPQPIKVNPNFGGNQQPAPRVRENRQENNRSSSPSPSRSSEPRYVAPSRSSTPSSAPSRGSGSSGSSTPASRPRPR